jgi:hypothetical protein
VKVARVCQKAVTSTKAQGQSILKTPGMLKNAPTKICLIQRRINSKVPHKVQAFPSTLKVVQCNIKINFKNVQYTEKIFENTCVFFFPFEQWGDFSVNFVEF